MMEAYNIQLLVDIRDVFAEKGLTEDVEGMPSADLVAALVAMPERLGGNAIVARRSHRTGSPGA